MEIRARLRQRGRKRRSRTSKRNGGGGGGGEQGLKSKEFLAYTESVFSVALLERDSYFIHKRGRQINNRAIKHRLRILKTDMS